MRLSVSRVALAVVVLVAVACGGGANNAGGGAAKSDITVGIDIPFHPLWDYVAAKSDTYFAGKPYKVHFKVLDATTQVPAFGKGDLDVLTTPPSFIPRIKDQYNLDVAEFFPLARWVIGPQILVPTGSRFMTLESLKGKKVAIAPLSTRFGAEEAAILAATGQTIRDYFSLVETDAAAQELTLGRVDAAFIEAPSTYPLLQSGKFQAIYSVHDAFFKAFADPAVVNGGYIARKSFLAANPGFVNDLVAATQDAWTRYQANPDPVNQVAAQQSGIPAAQLAAVGDVLDLKDMPKSLQAITPQDVKTWEGIFPLLQRSGFNKSTPKDPASLFVVTKS